MNRLAKLLACTLSFIILLAAALLINVWYFKPVTLDAFYLRTFAQMALDRPQMLSDMRALPQWLSFYDDKLDDASPAQDRRDAELARSSLDTLRRYDRNVLDAEGRLSYDTLEFFLRMQVEGDRFRLHGFPVNQTSGEQMELPEFMARVHQVTSIREGDAYVARLKLVPVKFAQLMESLELREKNGLFPPRFVLDKVIVQTQEFTALPAARHALYTGLKAKLEKIPPDKLAVADRERILNTAEAAITDSVYPAYRMLTDYLVGLRPKATSNDGAWHLPDGDAYYAWRVRESTTTDLTPAEIHATGLTAVERVGNEMDALLISQGLSEGSLGVRLQRLSHDPAQQYPDTDEGRQAMLARYQAILDEVNRGLGNAFDVRPKLGVEVRAVPVASQAGAPIAYYSAGSLDGSRPGIFYANQRKTSEMPKFEMRTIAYHEGIPGHHFQASLAQEQKDVPFFRKFVGFTAYSEGWALYAERLAAELGFQQDPLDNLGRLRWEMMRAVRLVVDTGIHYKRWTREQAIAYMMEKTGKDEGFVVAEIERYYVWPGQALSYQVGRDKILQLREKSKQALGPRFDLAQFHNAVLTHGSLPMVVLERVIDEWIERRKDGA